MKTDKKKLMRKLIAVGLMASMLTANTMTYGSSLILPSINAEAFSAEAETKLASITETYNISTMVADPESGIIEINITENGTYIFTGTNLRNEGQDDECYIDVQVTVNEGVEANFIFDDCTILNNCDIDNSGYGEYPEEAFVINGTVNIYVKSTSKILTYNRDDGSTDYAAENAITFTGNGTVNVMESEDKDKSLKISTINTASLNINGGILDVLYLRSKELAINDGMVYTAGDSGIQTSNISNVDTLSYKGGNAYLGGKLSDGTLPADSWFSNIGADKQITNLNGTKLKQTYSVNEDGGSLKAYIDHSKFSASNAPYLVADNELLVFTDLDNAFFKTNVNLGDPAKLKITKEYDGTTGFGNQTIEPITMNGYTLTPDLSAVTLTGSDVGEYTAKVPFKFTESETEYTFYYNVPVEITAKKLTATITANNKVYDKSAKADVEVTFEGLVGTLTEGVDYNITAEFADENVGTGKTVTATITLADNVTNYTLANDGVATTTADITAALLTITDATVEKKTYDGEKTAKVTEVKLGGVIDGDVVDYTATAEFADENVGTGKTVTATITLADTVKNYTLEKTTYETTADIIAAPLSVTSKVEDKVYDGTTAVTVKDVVFDGLVDDTLVLGTDYTVTAAFEDGNVGTDKAVNVTVTLKETAIANNYTISDANAPTAAITPASLTIKSATVADKTYDGTTDATVTAVELDGAIVGEKVEYTATAKFADEKVGADKGVTVTVALKNANYALAKATYETTADIIAKGVTIADAVVESKTYDGKTDAKVTSVTFKNEKGEVATPEYEATAVFTDASAGKGKEVIVTVTLKDDTYALTESKFKAKADIAAKELTIKSAAVANKTYDGTTDATVTAVELDGAIAGEKVDYTATAKFADENVGTGKTVTATITLADNVANYTLANDGVATTTADITAAPLTITGATVENKTYDGEKTAKVTEVKLDGVIDGDVVDYTATAEFADEKAGTDKGVTVTVKLADTVKNYTLEKTTYETTADIIAKGVTIADAVVESKTYDGKTDAKVTSVTFKNEKGEVVTPEYEATAAFADAAAGKGKEVIVTVTLKDDTYALTESKFKAKADIAAKELTIKSATVANKTYDGTTDATVTAVELDGAIVGEKVEYTATAKFADEKAGTDKDVTVTVALKNANYALAKATCETTADIIAKGVTIADVVVESKTYDGKTDAKVTSVTFKNEKGEIVTPEYEATAEFTDASAGEDKDVIVTVTLKDSTYTLTESKFTAKADIVEPVDSFVERLYTKLLGRESDEEGKEHNVGLIEENGYTAADIASGFVMSEEIKQKNLSNEEFVTRMYNTFMDREPDEDGLSHWVSALDDGCSYAYVLKNFIGSQEFNGICEEYGMETGEYQLTEPRDMNRNLTKFAARMYTKALGRPFDVDGINDWTNRYLTDVAEIGDIAYGFIFSTEFKNKNLNDSDYVDTLYRTFFDREPDEGGKQHWLEQLKNGASREDVMYGFVGSQECINLVNSFNI